MFVGDMLLYSERRYFFEPLILGILIQGNKRTQKPVVHNRAVLIVLRAGKRLNAR